MTGMKRVIVLMAGLAAASAGMTMAAQQRPYRVSDQVLKDLVNRLDAHRDAFHDSVGRAIDRSPLKGSPAHDEIDRSVSYFEQAADVLRDRVNDRQSGPADAENVLRRASAIDDLLMHNQLDTGAQSDWQTLRLDMDALARAYDIQWSWNADSQDVSPRVDDRQVERLLQQIGDKANQFDRSLAQAGDRNRVVDRREMDEIHRSVSDFRHATDRLRDRVRGRQSNTLDVEEVLRRGAGIDGFVQRYQLSAQAEQHWLSLRGDLEGLASAYNVAWNWGDSGYTPSEPVAGFRHRLSGTYQLETSRGDDPRQAAELAARAAPAALRQRTYQRLLNRLEAPDLIAIDRNGNSVTMASTRGGRVTVEADGRARSEQWSAGRTITTRATLEGERLVVATTGNRGSDFTVTFDPMDNGRSLRMTRTIDDEDLRRPVTVRSTYRRLSDEARWNIEVDLRRGVRDHTGPPADDFGVPDGTRFVAVLDNALSTVNVRDGDLYTMTALSPPQYEGAVIQGFVSGVDESRRWTGRAGMMLNLQSIRLRNGSSYQFDGLIEDIRTPDGEPVRVDREGTLDSRDSRAQKTVERGAIGAALGAIIGAIAGGGRGAAIGAVIGAGGGAGTVFIEGRDRLDLPRGTEVTITSGDPGNQRRLPGVQH